MRNDLSIQNNLNRLMIIITHTYYWFGSLIFFRNDIELLKIGQILKKLYIILNNKNTVLRILYYLLHIYHFQRKFYLLHFTSVYLFIFFECHENNDYYQVIESVCVCHPIIFYITFNERAIVRFNISIGSNWFPVIIIYGQNLHNTHILHTNNYRMTHDHRSHLHIHTIGVSQFNLSVPIHLYMDLLWDSFFKLLLLFLLMVAQDLQIIFVPRTCASLQFFFCNFSRKITISQLKRKKMNVAAKQSEEEQLMFISLSKDFFFILLHSERILYRFHPRMKKNVVRFCLLVIFK